MSVESAIFETKSEYSGTGRERFRIIKTIVSMANAQGGLIEIKKVTGGMRNLDSAALISTVNRYVDPPLGGIEAEVAESLSVRIRVPDSDRKPHIIKENGTYQDQAESRTAFHRGQIWIRHGSSNDLANPDDLRALIYGAAGNLLEVLGAKLKTPGFVLDPTSPAAVPARLVDSPDALLLQTDFASLYRHTRQSLKTEFQKSYTWISLAMRNLGLEGSSKYSFTDRNSAGHPTRWRYTDAAHDVLANKLEVEPDWDPSLSG